MGDLDTRKGAFADREAMAKGSRIHRKIQRQMGASYQAEVSMAHKTEFDEFAILVEGRADGVMQTEENVVIDEIKGVHRDLRFLEEPMEVHLAQAKCYAFFWSPEKSKAVQCGDTVIWIQRKFDGLRVHIPGKSWKNGMSG